MVQVPYGPVLDPRRSTPTQYDGKPSHLIQGVQFVHPEKLHPLASMLLRPDPSPSLPVTLAGDRTAAAGRRGDAARGSCAASTVAAVPADYRAPVVPAGLQLLRLSYQKPTGLTAVALRDSTVTYVPDFEELAPCSCLLLVNPVACGQGRAGGGGVTVHLMDLELSAPQWVPVDVPVEGTVTCVSTFDRVRGMGSDVIWVCADPPAGVKGGGWGLWLQTVVTCCMHS